jgi:uncharacterized membrane protein YfcA
VVIACFIDVTRLSVYSKGILKNAAQMDIPLIVCATLSAFLGAFIGSRLLKKMTVPSFQVIVAISLIVFGLLLGAGIV